MNFELRASVWKRVLVLAVHPDDESLGAGGLLQQAVEKGAAVRVVFITDGDNNPWPQRIIERRWRIGAAGRARWGRRRQDEARAALDCLGVGGENACFWHYPDQGIAKILLNSSEEFRRRLVREIQQWRPTLLVGPSTSDLHRDHNAVGVLLHFALSRLNFRRESDFALLHYVVHGREPQFTDRNSVHLALTPAQQKRKRDAIHCHATQMTLSSRRFLAFARETESFLVSETAAASDRLHAVPEAFVREGFLHLKLDAHRSGRLLDLVADDPITGGFRRQLKLSNHSDQMAVKDAPSGGVVGLAQFIPGSGKRKIAIPLAALQPARDVFIKVDRTRGFFDTAGWRQVSFPWLATPTNGAESSPPGKSDRPVVCCVVPCYNLARVCGPIVREAASYAQWVIAVNDGSTDDTGRVLREVARGCHGRVQVLEFAGNRGKGWALLEAFRHALEKFPLEVIVTLDGDGQHQPADIPRLAAAAAESGAALVLGERLDHQAMPWRSRVGNRISAAILRGLYPAAPLDTQSGLRALNSEFVREIVRVLEGGRYETELQMLLLALEQSRSILTTTIPTLYFNGNQSSHFRPFLDSWRIYRTLWHWRRMNSKSAC